MFKKFIPDFYYENISCINLDVLKEKGIKYVICDVDNTLDSHNVPRPSDKAVAFLKKLEDYGFTVCIISNGRHERVKEYLSDYSLEYIAKAGKPLKKSYIKAMKKIGADANSCAFIGDQIFTDILGANIMGLTSILVTPIEQYENAFFYLKRALEKIVISKITKE